MKLRIIDTTLRDGMHPVKHQFSPEDMADIASGLEAGGVDTIEIGQGDGLEGSSYQYGFAKASDKDYLKAVSQVLNKTKLAVLLIPGIGTHKGLEIAAQNGVKVVRVATHVTEADISEQHIRMAKDMGMEVVGFLMMAHMAEPAKIVEQAKLFERYGADLVYVTDSAGALLPSGVTARVKALKEAVSIPVGFHAHNNLGLALGNSIAAYEAGATSLDGCLAGLGAGAGNAQTEILAAVFSLMGVETGLNLYALMDAAEDRVRPRMLQPPLVDRNTLTLGYAGVYSSFLLHAERASQRFGVDTRDILVELGRRKTVGGQEDLIIDVAHELAKAAGKA